jgi:excisionase family DNA binding protein
MQKENASLPNFMTVGEVADLMRVSSMTVYRLIKAGDLGAVRVGKSYRIREDDVNTFIASRYNQTG